MMGKKCEITDFFRGEGEVQNRWESFFKRSEYIRFFFDSDSKNYIILLMNVAKSSIFYFTLNKPWQDDKIYQRIFERVQACGMAYKNRNKELFPRGFRYTCFLWALSFCC